MQKRSKDSNFSPTMIMEGDSGSGKSTSAFIIAGLLNCENPKSYSSPCGECPSCRDITEERFHRDVHFFDGSNMGKEDVVELEKLAGSIPFYDRNKIIIIDEAQELSKKGFGATLKLLEKKRKNTYIILCTMNVRAIDKPVKDRCQVYRFWPVAPEVIAEYLFGLLRDRSDIPDTFFKEGIFLIADYSGGSVRAALQNAERCIYGEIFDKESIERELGFLSPDTLAGLITKLLRGDPKFFMQLRETNESIEEFYNKSWAALLEAKLRSMGAVDTSKLPAWKKKYHTQYLQYPEAIDKILGAYERIFESSKYLKSDYFLTKIYREMMEIPQLHKPIRRRRSKPE